MQADQRQRALERLTPSIRQTVDIIHLLYQEGATPQQLTLNRISEARVEQGLPAGSQSTLQKAKDAWITLYAIDTQEKKGSPVIREALANRLIDLVAKEVSQEYQSDAQQKVAAAETKVVEAETRCATVETENATLRKDVEQLTTTLAQSQADNATLTLERDNFRDTLARKEADLQQQTATLDSKEANIIDLGKQLQEAKTLADEIKQGAEVARTDFIARIDRLETQATQSQRENTTLTNKLHQQRLAFSEEKAHVTALTKTQQMQQSQLRELQTEKLALQKKVNHHKDAADDLQRQHVRLEAETKNKVQQLTMLQQQLGDVQTEKQRLLTLVEQTQQAYAQLEKSLTPKVARGKNDT